MAQEYQDQFYFIDPNNPPDIGTPLSPVNLTITDNNDDANISERVGDAIDGVAIRNVYDGDSIEVRQSDGTIVEITGVTFVLEDDRVVLTPTDQSVLGEVTYQDTTGTAPSGGGTVATDRLAPVCFTSGTLLLGEQGNPVLIDELRPGDKVRVVTSNEAEDKPVRWISRRTIFARDMESNPKLRPVRISAGSLGNGIPTRDLVVSREHRMMTGSRIAKRMFDTTEILIPAIRLTELPGIYVDDDATEVTYFHLLFEEHEIVVAEGAASESLFVGAEALKSISDEAREELLTIFPEFGSGETAAKPARKIPSAKEQRKLVERHIKNGLPLFGD
ncbi:Hint domain-containing protein [Paracoccus albus]|uniref:Hint domain-containing protein n=1 Tax=Paracoccus albus TaxID=3017784 RepID=UPI0022EFEF0A|nr:Hint domain-containing protein [Paracoccus albus]WBU60608.1 Hint domain-containing protein [Paracoccus albus]